MGGEEVNTDNGVEVEEEGIDEEDDSLILPAKAISAASAFLTLLRRVRAMLGLWFRNNGIVALRDMTTGE